ncbi:MAG: hypothetical protein A4E71_02140 [Smithella sp. PtaU1.Bin162]|nr:MAG: hypothetical protein A4E71_02140 [Smithella sp. PtaU1.Bin162]
MIEFEIKKDCLILKYLSEPDNGWLIENLNNDESVILKNTFRFSKNDLFRPGPLEDDPDTPIEFVLGRLRGEYYKIDGRIMGTTISIFLYKSIKVSIKFFIAVKSIPVFKKISAVLTEDIFIGGSNANALPEAEFRKLIKNFPNTYELQKYAEARISAVLKNYVDSIIDGEEKYNTYMNKKISQKGLNLSEKYKYQELEKYEAILHKLEKMLDSEESYNEKQWQAEILQIILLLYPKYICVFPEAPVKDTYHDKNKKIDLLLVDSSGNTDILEIKKPFDNCIVTKAMYRDNYIPLRELSGTVMQIEKYIYYLNKWGKKGEEMLTRKYKDKLPTNFKIKIINPTGIIVMGRDNNISTAQKEDFEVIKRKYKNIMDIITYDDLISRLRFTIDQYKKT